MEVTRPERVAEFMREEISRIIIHELSDPRIGFVTVTGVDVSPDLANARVSVSVMGTDAQKRTSLRGLRNSASFIQTAVFRPRYRSKKVDGLYFTGQYVHPGIGVPMTLIASQIVTGEMES